MFRRIRILLLVFAHSFEGRAHVLSRRVEQGSVERGLRIQHRMGSSSDNSALIEKDISWNQSPLSRLALSIALLRKENPSTGQDLLLRMDKDIGVLDKLMGQLLTLSRFEAGISGTRHDTVDLCQLVEEVGANANFEAASSDKRVDVRIKGEAVLPTGDNYALRSACENIVRNAVRFTQPGTSVEIDLSVERGPIADAAIISVRDRGPGVPEEMLEAIFEPFVRVEGETTTAASNGLGLAIAAGAIRLHHGSIVASNRSGGGLEVLIRVPIDVAEEKHASVSH